MVPGRGSALAPRPLLPGRFAVLLMVVPMLVSVVVMACRAAAGAGGFGGRLQPDRLSVMPHFGRRQDGPAGPRIGQV
jgi:hypothetical protein